MSDQLRIGAAYIRVSTDEQLELSPESQLEEIQEYCNKHNILLSHEYIFVEEEGKSGRKSQNREAFQRMISTAKTTPKPFDVIIVWKFSRFARNQDESTFYKSMLRKKLHIDVESISEPIIEGMYGRLMEMIIEWQDEYYSVNLSTEVKRSMKMKAKKGLYNSTMPLGYHKEKDSFPVIVEEEAQIVRTIFQLFTSGYDKNYIARHLNNLGYQTSKGNKFDNESINYILSNPFYIGKVRWNMRESSSSSKYKDESEWIIADSHHEPIIDTDTWEAAQQRNNLILLNREKYAHPVSHTKHWLSGLVKCSICGKSLSYKHGYVKKNSKDGKSYGEGFQCLGYRQCLHNESQFISEKKLTKHILESLKKVCESSTEVSFEVLRSSNQDINIERKMYQNELKGLDRKEQRIKEAYVNGIDSMEEYKINKELLLKRRKELETLLNNLDNVSLDPKQYKGDFSKKVTSVVDILESDAPYELKAESIRSIVKKIIFYKENQTLEFHYYISI